MTAEFLTAETLPVRHGFFTRRGGVSEGAYASLNCSLSSGDAPERITANRALVAAALEADPARLVGLTQVHGADVAVVTEPWAFGAGPRADGMVTDRPGIALGIITADCAPVLFADPEAGVVGAAHAGWRSAVGGVLEATVRAMRDLGARPERIVAAIGPCIAQASYEIAADMRDAVLAAGAEGARFFTPGTRPERWQFDLASYCAARLAGEVARVGVLGVDTATDHERFFSHRRRTLAGGGPIGHQISVVVA
jgi:polyphenol oxidase